MMKLILFKSIVLPRAKYASETWPTTGLDVFQQICLRRILQIIYTDHVAKEECDMQYFKDIVRKRLLGFTGHILRMSHHRHDKRILNWPPSDGKL